MKIVTGQLGSVAPGGRSAIWAATGRLGGHSRPPFDELNLASYVGDAPEDVERNLQIAATSIGLATTNLVLMKGVHGAQVLIVERGGPVPDVVPGFDALVTKSPGVGLVVLAADCVPLVLADVVNQVVGAVHCGWRGLTAGVVPAAVEQMRLLGADQLQAVIGPSICVKCYPVPPERVLEVRAGLPAVISAAACPDSEVPCLDVGAGVHAQLAAAGVSPRKVQTLAGCTAHTAGLFSYRRDGVTGRQGMLVRL